MACQLPGEGAGDSGSVALPGETWAAILRPTSGRVITARDGGMRCLSLMHNAVARRAGLT